MTHSAAVVAPEVRLSEIHYDNAGTDAGEAIEISGPAGASLDGWSVVLYNGNGGAVYNTRTLSGSIPATCGGRGVVVLGYPVNGIQNGDPDGIALVSPGGVVEFLSYGGAMTAVGGAANGLVSQNLAVKEGSTVPAGHSLQRSESDPSFWAAPAPNSFGSCNAVTPPPTDPGDPGDPGDPTPPPGPVSVVEIHYDNDGADAGERIEVEGPAGYRLSGWSLVLYNGSNGASYQTIALDGVIPALGAGRGVLVFAAPGLQNGSPDGIALVDGFGAVVEFLSYEGTFTATSGPANGHASTDIGVRQSGGEAAGLSLQKDADGWYGPAAESFGALNVEPGPRMVITGRDPGDGPLPVGFEDQLFADVRNSSNQPVPEAVTWSSDTPAILSVDPDGVIRALAAGTGVVRATSASGVTATFSQSTYVATASPDAQYVGNTEFGVPTDSDASDDHIVSHPQYTASFNRNRGIPNWVSFNLEASHFGSENRCDCFTFDATLPSGFRRYTTADYTGAGAFHGYSIDRGHLVRSFDRTRGSLDNANTFLFTNIIPQAADNNQGPWADLEMHLGDLARSGEKELYVIAGASGSKGTVKNEGIITIPTHVWKVAVILRRDQRLADVDSHDDVELIAVIMPNEPGIRNEAWTTYRTTADAVETLSGYDLLARLADDIEGLLETGLSRAQSIVDALAAGGTLGAGAATSLSSKLRAAAASYERGNRVPAQNQLNAFINEVGALERSGRLDAAQAARLRSAAQEVIDAH